MSLASNVIFLVLVIICIYNRCLYLNQKSINEMKEEHLHEMKHIYNDLLHLHSRNLTNTSGVVRSCVDIVKYYRMLEEQRKAEEGTSNEENETL